MTEEDARLALLQTQLNGLQTTIRGLDTTMAQVKGWCITVSLAIGGFAVGQKRPALLAVGVAAVAGFYILTCQAKVVQRFFLDQNEKLDNDIKDGIAEVLAGRSHIPVTGTTVFSWNGDKSYFRMMIHNFGRFREAAVHPDTYTLYLFITACFAVAAIVLLT